MTVTPTAYHRHDHRSCVAETLAAARRLCREKGARLTPIREQVLTIICNSHQPMGAYAVLEELGRHQASHPAPPTVYRALDFLQEHGLVHRIASLNAYLACSDPAEHHHSHFLICRHCQTTVEASEPRISEAIAHCARRHDFQLEAACVEIVGCCPNCR